MRRERLETKGLKAAGQLVAWVQGPAFSRGSAIGEARPSERGRSSRKKQPLVGCRNLARERSQMKKKIVCVYLGVHRHMCRPEDNCECHFSDAIHFDLGTKSLIDLDRT